MTKLILAAAVLASLTPHACGQDSVGDAPPPKKMEYRFPLGGGRYGRFVLDGTAGLASFSGKDGLVQGNLVFDGKQKIVTPEQKELQGWVYRFEIRKEVVDPKAGVGAMPGGVYRFESTDLLFIFSEARVPGNGYALASTVAAQGWKVWSTDGQRTVIEAKPTQGPAVTQKELAAAVCQLIKEKKEDAEKPFTIQGKVLKYDTRQFTYGFSLSPRVQIMPIESAADLQVQVEIMRGMFLGNEDVAHWQPYLEKIEQLVVEQLKADQTNQPIYTAEDAIIASAYLTKGIKTWALKKGYVVEDPERQVKGAELWEIELRIQPKATDVEVYYMRWRDYYVLQKTNRLKDLDTYGRLLPSKLETGDYFVWAKAPGKSSQPKSVSIGETSRTVTVTLQAGGQGP